MNFSPVCRRFLMTTPPSLTPDGSQVTIADLFRVLSGIQSDLREQTSQLKVLDVKFTQSSNTASDHEARIRELETLGTKAIATAKAWGAAIGAASGLITGIVA